MYRKLNIFIRSPSPRWSWRGLARVSHLCFNFNSISALKKCLKAVFHAQNMNNGSRGRFNFSGHFVPSSPPFPTPPHILRTVNHSWNAVLLQKYDLIWQNLKLREYCERNRVMYLLQINTKRKKFQEEILAFHGWTKDGQLIMNLVQLFKLKISIFEIARITRRF